jgi:muramoyltetrapeptide carboxypeptidase
MNGVRALMSGETPRDARKPQALMQGSVLAMVAPASPGSDERLSAGIAELERLGFSLKKIGKYHSEGYFAASAFDRFTDLVRNLKAEAVEGVIGVRGGYGSNYLLGDALSESVRDCKVLIGYSDLSFLQIFFWERLRWVTFYGPMVAAGFDAGAGAPGGYDEESLRAAINRPDAGWKIALRGQTLVRGRAEGRLLGGAMTIVEATLGSPWELDTRGAIVILEDRAMKPYQVDRVLMHFKQAGKLDGVAGIVLGDFPECEPPVAGSPTVRDVCARILGPLGVPVVFGAPIGHTMRSMLTIPLGVNARLNAAGEGTLEILEAAVTR